MSNTTTSRWDATRARVITFVHQKGGEPQKPATTAHPGKRRPGTKQFMLYMPPDLHTAVQLCKAMTGEDMGDIMLSILREGLAEEPTLVHRLKQ